MSHNVKARPADAAAAIQKFLEAGGRVTLRGIDAKTVKHDTWQRSKVTVGYKLKELRDGQ